MVLLTRVFVIFASLYVLNDLVFINSGVLFPKRNQNLEASLGTLYKSIYDFKVYWYLMRQKLRYICIPLI